MPAFLRDHAQFPGIPSGTAVADLDGDGKDDLLVITTDFVGSPTGNDRLYVFYQRPDGLSDVKFIATSGTPVNTGWTWSVVPCDIDADGKKEILVGYGFGDLTVYKLAADGTPFLSATMPGVRANRILCADLDGDGLSDVVTVGKIGVNMQVFLQRAGGLVEEGNYPSDTVSVTSGGGTYNFALDIGDINGDGKPDIAFFGRSPLSGKVTLNAYMQSAPGQFAAPVTLDFPRDSDDALPANNLAFVNLQPGSRNLVVSLGGNAPSARIVVSSHAVGGQTLSTITLNTWDAPTAIQAKDLNGDGRPDIVVFHNGFGAIGLYYQKADGTFSAEQLLNTLIADQALGPNVIAFGDFDSDGKVDIAVADQTAEFVFVQQ